MRSRLKAALLPLTAALLFSCATSAEAASPVSWLETATVETGASENAWRARAPRPHEVSGTVESTDDGQSLPGVNVVVKGTSTGTVTGPNGEYEITAPSPTDTLVFSFVGYETQEVPIRGRSQVDVTLQASAVKAAGVVVTGYQKQRETNLTGAVSVVEAEEVQSTSDGNFVKSLQGRAAGLNVLSDGTPGGGNSAVRIRGFSSLYGNAPLFVIDGVPTQTGFETLNPRDIESIQVLKDASAASVYGARAANGVIVVTTKQGGGDLSVSFDSYVGTQTLPDHMEMLNAREWGEVYYRARRNDGVPNPAHPQYTFEEGSNGEVNVGLPQYIDPPDDGNGEVIPAGDTNWFDTIFGPSLEQQYNLSISRGGDNSSVAVTGSYFNQQGILEHTEFERFTARINSDYEFSDYFRIGENVTVDHHNEVRLADNFTENAITMHPLVPVRKEEPSDEFAGPTDGLGDRLNPLGVASRNQDNAFRNWRIFGSAFAEAEPIDRLTLRSTYGLDYSNVYQRAFTPRFDEGQQQNVNNELSSMITWGLNSTWTNTAEYDALFGNHSLTVLGGVEYVHQYNEEFNATRRDFFLNEDRDYHFIGAGSGEQLNGGGGTEAALFSLFSKADYNYDDTYLASATLRRDASSRLGRGSRADFFPAFSLGWRVSNEPFLDGADALSNLKLRFGYGQTGNQGIGNFAPFTFYNYSAEFSVYDIDGDQTNTEPGFFRSSIGNQGLEWERTTEYNLGLDVGLWDDRLSLSSNYFIRSSEGLLLQEPQPAVVGEGSDPFVNAGTISSNGLEVELGYTDDFGDDFTLDLNGNVSAVRSKVEELAEGVDFLGSAEGRLAPGHAVPEFYGWVYDGLFQSAEEVENHADQGFATPEAGVGRLRYRDLNGDGVINADDRKFIGNPSPDFTYGLNADLSYKNFDLSFFLQGEQGKDIFNGVRRVTDFAFFNFNYSKRTLDAWTPNNRDTDVPKLTAQNTNDELRTSTYFIEDGSYLRLQRATLGYTLPAGLAERISAQRARIYVKGSDLFTITSYSGNDPELGVRGPFDAGIDANFYPHARQYTLGVNLTF